MQPIGARGLSPSRQLGTVGAMLLATVLAAAHPAAAITRILPSAGSLVDRTGTIVFGRVLSAAAAPDGLPRFPAESHPGSTPNTEPTHNTKEHFPMRRIAFFALPIALFLAPAHAQTVSDGVKPSEERDFRLAQAQKAQALTVLEHVTADPGRGLFPEEVRAAESSVPDVVSAESRTDFRVRGFGGEVVNLPHPVTDGPCTPTADVLQFDGDYRVRMCYITGEGETGQAQAGVWASSQSGILWFFSRENAEVLVKVLDGCEYNGHRWVFVAPVTDLGFELRVTGPDGDTWTHTNEAGTTAPTKSDTSAFRCSSEGTVPEFSGPEMVVIPAGSFEMGCVSGVRCRDNEFPVHSVTIPAPFAVGKYEVTFSEWDACVESGGCGHVPNDEGWGRDNRPVVGVSWEDAQEYVAWLSGETGFEYRLLSESEWEYAARAGTGTAYSWGNEIGRNRANCGGCSSPWELGGTAPVGSFAANAFGLHDMHGNVWEWVEDCWNESYVGAPSDGSAWLRGDCSERAFRGGSWGFGPSALRSAVRFSIGTGFRNNDLGFRVARTLTP